MQTHWFIFSRTTKLELQKQALVSESNRSIELLRERLRTEQSQLNEALQQYQPHGSWTDALERLMQELLEAEQQEHDQIVCCLQRLEELDDQVSKPRKLVN